MKYASLNLFYCKTDALPISESSNKKNVRKYIDYTIVPITAVKPKMSC